MKVTVGIPTYNGEKFIKETIQSVLNQTYRDLEIIVIDDASNDNTFQIIKSFKNSRIKYSQNKYNIGLTKNINKMVSEAEGVFCIILGQDDILLNKHIEESIKEFEKEEIVLVHCNANYIDEHGRDLNMYARENNKQNFKNNNPLNFLAFDNYIQSCGMIFRKKAFLDVGGWEEKYPNLGEWLIHIKMAKYGKFGYCDKTFSYYRKHPSSLIKKLNNEKIFHLFLYHTRCRYLAFKYAKLNLKSKIKFFIIFTLSIFTNLKKFLNKKFFERY